MSFSRRQMLATSAAGAATVGMGAMAGPASAATPDHRREGDRREREMERGHELAPVGPLVDDPRGLLALPVGFSYTVISQAGVTTMDDGAKSPDRPDGTGAFSHRDGTLLAQNHELGGPYPILNPVPKARGTVYDDGLTMAGGVTVIELDRHARRVGERVALSGTISNCAGGVTPWDTWLSCEETEARAGEDFGDNGATTVDHGWVFEVDPDPHARQDPRPIRCLGRFAHEAVVVSASGRALYLTEDASGPNGLFYRWVVPSHLRLGRGVLPRLSAGAGRLQAMQVSLPGGQVIDDLSRFTSADIGRALKVRWVDVPDRFAATTSVRAQDFPSPVTRSKKLEGAWADAYGVFFDASFSHGKDTPVGGVDHDGQIWYFDERAQTLTLKAYFPYVPFLHDGSLSLAEAKKLPTDYFDGPDNVHVTPYGGLVIAEDGDGVNGLVGWTHQTGAFRLARNDVDFNGDNSEMTGPTFSPDGRLLFANQQEPGHTYAISGPWKRHFG